MPIPPQHLLGLIAGVILQSLFNQRLFAASWIGDVFGLLLIAVGIGFSAWAVLEAKDTKIETPDRLIIGGPYSLSRNPMYLAWTLLVLGIGPVVNSLRIIVLLPVMTANTHFVDIRTEERILEQQFGDEYRNYKGQVRPSF